MSPKGCDKASHIKAWAANSHMELWRLPADNPALIYWPHRGVCILSFAYMHIYRFATTKGTKCIVLKQS